MEKVIEVEHLRKRYGRLVAVADVSFSVSEGEIFGLLGRNGAGKTTTVECLQGLRRADGGTMRVLGLDPGKEAQAIRRRVGCQLQESALPDRMRVWEALDLFSSLGPARREWCGLLEEWGLAIAVVGSLLVGLASSLAHHIHAPQSIAGVVGAFLLSTLTFASVGVLLGALLPTARAAQGAGALLWFVMMILGGAGPPPEVLTGALGVVAKITPAHHAVLLLQGPWLGFGWDTQAMLVLLGFLAVSALLTVRFFRWD